MVIQGVINGPRALKAGLQPKIKSLFTNHD